MPRTKQRVGRLRSKDSSVEADQCPQKSKNHRKGGKVPMITDTGSERSGSDVDDRSPEKAKKTSRNEKEKGTKSTRSIASSSVKSTKTRTKSRKATVDTDVNTAPSAKRRQKRKMLSGSESDEEVQTRPKTRKISGSAATTKAVEKPRKKKSKKEDSPQPAKRTVSPTNKLTRETYNATVSPQKGKRSRSPKRRVGWEYQRDVHVAEKIHKKWRLASVPEKEFVMNIIDTYMSSILNKTSSRRYDLVLEQLNLLKARLWKTISRDSVPDSDQFNWQELDSAMLTWTTQIDTMADQHETVNRAIEQLTADLEKLEQQRNSYEEAAAEERETVMAMEFSTLQRVLPVNDANGVRLLCVRDDQEDVVKPRNAELEEENDRLLDKLTSHYENVIP